MVTPGMAAVLASLRTLVVVWKGLEAVESVGKLSASIVGREGEGSIGVGVLDDVLSGIGEIGSLTSV